MGGELPLEFVWSDEKLYLKSSPSVFNSACSKGWMFMYRRQKLHYAILHPNGRQQAPTSAQTHSFHREKRNGFGASWPQWALVWTSVCHLKYHQTEL